MISISIFYIMGYSLIFCDYFSIYESSVMRALCGTLALPTVLSGDNWYDV